MLQRNRLLVMCALAGAVALSSFHHPAAWAEVVVLAGSAAGRVGKEPDASKVNEPFAVAFDAEGRMYGVEYTRGNRLFRITKPSPSTYTPELAGSTPQVEFVAGVFYVPVPKQSFPPDTATAAGEVRFHGLHDVAIGPDGAVYVADTFNHRIRAFEPKSGTVRVVAGTGVSGFAGDGGPATAAQFNQAYCGTLLPDGAAMLVADIGNSRLRRIDLVAGTVETIVGNGQRGKPVNGAKALETPLAGPRAACQAKDGTIYLALREGNALVEIKQGVVRTVVNAAGKGGYGGDGGPGCDALLAGPKYVAFDREGRVLIADTENHCIRRYDPAAGTIELVAGMPPRGGATVGADLLSTQLLRPHGCCLDPLGRLVIADSDNDRIIVGGLRE